MVLHDQLHGRGECVPQFLDGSVSGVSIVELTGEFVDPAAYSSHVSAFPQQDLAFSRFGFGRSQSSGDEDGGKVRQSRDGSTPLDECWSVREYEVQCVVWVIPGGKVH